MRNFYEIICPTTGNMVKWTLQWLYKCRPWIIINGANLHFWAPFQRPVESIFFQFVLWYIVNCWSNDWQKVINKDSALLICFFFPCTEIKFSNCKTQNSCTVGKTGDLHFEFIQHSALVAIQMIVSDPNMQKRAAVLPFLTLNKCKCQEVFTAASPIFSLPLICAVQISLHKLIAQNTYKDFLTSLL